MPLKYQRLPAQFDPKTLPRHSWRVLLLIVLLTCLTEIGFRMGMVHFPGVTEKLPNQWMNLLGSITVAGGAALVYWFFMGRILHRQFSTNYQGFHQSALLSQELKRSLDEHSLVSITDLQGKIFHVNEKFCEVSGYSPEELIGQDHRIINSGIHDREHIRNLWRTIARGQTWRGEFCNRAKSGEIFWVKTTIFPCLDASGKPYQYIAIRTEITEMKRFQARAETLNERMRNILAASPTVIYAHENPEDWMRCTFISGNIEQITGYSVEEALEQPDFLYTHMHPDDKPKLLGIPKRLWEEGEIEYEYRFLAATGYYLWLRNTAKLIRGADGEILSIVGSLADINAQKAMEENLERLHIRQRENEVRLHSIIDTALDGIVQIDEHDGIIDWNRQAETIFGWKQEEVIGRLLSEVILPAHRRETYEMGLRYFLDKDGQQMLNRRIEMVALHRQGHEFPIELALTAYRMNQGYEFCAFIRDITERKRAEERLKTLSTAVEQSPASVLITDTLGTIQYVNPFFTQSSGYSRIEVLGQNCRLFKSGLVPIETYRELWDTIRSGRVWQGTITNRRKDGSLHWENMHIAPVKNGKGEIVNYVAVKLDVTEQKHHEEELLQAKEAADVANRTKSAFLANMSHEIRTPMNGVLGMLEALRFTPMTSEQRELADVACLSAESLLEVINDILDFSKIEAGKLQLETIDFDIRALVEDICTLLAWRAHEKHIDFNCYIPLDTPTLLRGDPTRLRQVFSNLIGNAVKFTEQGEIFVAVVCVARDQEKAEFLCTVRDTGIGISLEAQQNLFKPFSQADGGINRRFGGSGLGLTIAKNLVARMGGEIGLDSTPGEGSTFPLYRYMRNAAQLRMGNSGRQAEWTADPGGG